MASNGKISVAEITKHSSAEDCWVVVNAKVYDLSKFAPNHPGGAHMIYKWAGKDGSESYNEYHSANLIENELSPSEKLGDLDESTVTETWLEAQKQETTQKPADPNEKPPLSALINLNDFEEAFAKAGSQKAWAYIWAGSNDLLSLHANKALWAKLWFTPRILRNVSHVNTRSTLLGNSVSAPIMIQPMGIAKNAGPEGEKALGAGAAASGIIHCMSTTASLSIEEILSSVPPAYPYFFQLYVDRNRDKTAAVLQRIEKDHPNIRAIFITVDLPVVSKREADERLIVQESVSVYMNSAKSNVDAKGGGLARTTGSFIDPALTWDDIPWIRKHTSKPLILKGIQSPADALLAHANPHISGIVLSNHGGRALDSSPGTLLTLLELRLRHPHIFTSSSSSSHNKNNNNNNRTKPFEIYIDGGIRRGSDILKATLLGAHGVGVGRPFQCSIMYDTPGVRHCAAILQDELETAMRLAGISDLDAVRGDISWLNTCELEGMLPPRPKGWLASWLSGESRRVSKL